MSDTGKLDHPFWSRVLTKTAAAHRWPTYNENGESLRVQAQNISLIKDDFRAASIDFIIQNRNLLS